ncbi:MAG: hypothetical protein Ct9H300mP1_37380 [Planctomycetaceae bacterium]|nr:MAG: hypothetical protein Ct9H300mP1_37380 [Planctomycetaceae bacterium]
MIRSTEVDRTNANWGGGFVPRSQMPDGFGSAVALAVVRREGASREPRLCGHLYGPMAARIVSVDR